MKSISIILFIGCLFVVFGCQTFQTAYFGVEDEAIRTPADFGKTQEFIEKAKRHGDSLYADKQVDKAMELGKTASITYWECHEQEAKDILALARQAALNAEAFYPQPAPPVTQRVNAVAGAPDSPETIAAPAPYAELAAPLPELQIEGADESPDTGLASEADTEPQKIQPETAKPRTPQAAITAPEPDPGQPQYGIQVAALKKADNADFVGEKFTAKGYPVYQQKAEVDGVTWYRVRLGPYSDKEEAEKILEEIQSSGLAGGSFLIREP
jgi:cell division protein FtsN